MVVGGNRSIYYKVKPDKDSDENKKLDPMIEYAMSKSQNVEKPSSAKFQGHVDYGSEDPDHTHDEYTLTKENCCSEEVLAMENKEFSIKTPKWFKRWLYSESNELAPYLETLLFMFDIVPLMLMCQVLAKTAYHEYDEITMELECMNKAFEGFRLLWHHDGQPVEKFLDFTAEGY